MDWTPQTRRQRTTRREQNLALLGAVVSGAVIAFGLVLLVGSRIDPVQGAALRGAAMDFVAPVWRIVRVPFDGLAAGVARVGDYVDAGTQNRQLKAELVRRQAALDAQAAALADNRRMRALLGVVEPGRGSVATARIAGASGGAQIRTAIISAGRKDGVVPGQPVRTSAGILGRTVEVGETSARVLLLADVSSRVPVIIERTGEAALVTGANRALVEIRDRSGPEVELVAGDRLITSGDGGIYPPGLPVAVVVDGRHQPPLARPAASAVGAGLVLVEAAYLPLPGSEAARAPAAPAPRAVASAPSIPDEPPPPPPAAVVAGPVPALRYTPQAMARVLLPPAPIAGPEPETAAQ